MTDSYMSRLPKARPTPGPASMDLLAADLAAAAQLRTALCLRDGLEHELRSPLNSIVLNLELLKELIRAAGADEGPAQLRRIEVVTAAVARLQEGLGAIWRELEAPVDDITRFDLSELLDEVQRAISAQLRQQRLVLEAAVDGEAVWVRGRRGSLRQAFLHLLGYAMQASCRDRRIGLSLRREAGALVVEIEDSGGGIEPSLQDQLFELPYAAGPEAPGVVLFAAHRLIAAEGGELSLKASGPEGSTFAVHLPEATS